MRRTIIKYLLIVAACIAAVFFLFRDHIPFGRGNTDFAVKPGIAITGIDLIKGKQKVSLRKAGDTWKVNDTAEARKSAVYFLLKTLNEVKIKSPVTTDIFRTEVVEKKIEPVRVVVYHNWRPIKSFYVYKTSSNLYGNIMKMKIGSKPYINYIPGYEDNIGSHFIADKKFWLPFTAFNLLPSEIESVEVQNLRDQTSSFKVIRKEGGFTLADRGSDSVKVRRYISYFTSVSFESWATELTEKERSMIESSEPLFRIKVLTRSAGVRILTVWERNLNHGSGEKDTDRVWAELNDGKGIFIMRYFDLDPLLKKRVYFFPG